MEEEKSIEDQFFELEVNLNRLSFEQQFHLGMYYAYVKLKEQEIRNIVWIADCISQDQKSEIDRCASSRPPYGIAWPVFSVAASLADPPPVKHDTQHPAARLENAD